MRGIFYMLHLLGFDAEVAKIDTLWQAFLKNVNNPVPANYTYIFPQALIEALDRSVLKGCQKIDLRSYLDQLKKFNSSISQILNDAWTQVLGNPSNYKVWEEQNIDTISGLI